MIKPKSISHDGSMVLDYESQHLPHFYDPHVDKYTSTMDPMGMVKLGIMTGSR